MPQPKLQALRLEDFRKVIGGDPDQGLAPLILAALQS